MDENFQISESSQAGKPVLSVRGEIDLSTAPELREHLLMLASNEPSVVIVDLSDVTFLDSTALGVLVSGLKRLRSEGGDLRLVVNRPNLLKVFEITGLTDLFSMHETLESACQ